MTFRDAPAVEEAVYQMRLAEYPRARNRAEINRLFNGVPPYTEEEVKQDGREGDVNVNDLAGTHIDMAARGQFENALIAPNPLIEVSVDYGPGFKKQEYSQIVTRHLNLALKKSAMFMEEEDATFAQLVLHGIGPAMWQDRYAWCPLEIGIEDVLIPSETLRSMRNLPFLAIYRSYTAGELLALTRGPHRDPAWNMPLVKKMVRWVNEQAVGLLGNRWPEWQKPESLVELAKENSGLYWSDNIPTIDTYDFYFYNDDGKRSGWNRRIILDVWGQPGLGGGYGGASEKPRMDANKYANSKFLKTEDTRQFLYNPGQRVYGSDLSEILHFQFGDASAVAPFRYHTVRSLGFLLYAVCHLENRMKCRFFDHVFESLLQYFRVANPADAQRVTNMDLINRGVIPEGVQFVPNDQRWQIQDGVVEQAVNMLRGTMQENSSTFTQSYNAGDRHPAETATKTMADVNATAQLIGAILSRAYNYQKGKFQEIGRRFTIEDSRNPDVKKFRLNCLKDGLPVGAFNASRWDVQPVRVSGNGNRMLQMAIAEKLLAVRPLHGPQAQAAILRNYDSAISGDHDLANRLNPTVQHVSDTVKAAESDAGLLLQGIQTSPAEGLDESEYISNQLRIMALKIKVIESASKGTATLPEVIGLSTLAANIGQHIKILAQDQTSKAKVKKFGDDLGKLMNLVKGYSQRLQEQQAKNGNGVDAETQAKIQALILQSRTKAKLAEKSHAERTAQKQISFEQKLKQDQQKHQHELVKSGLDHMQKLQQGRVNLFDEGET